MEAALSKRSWQWIQTQSVFCSHQLANALDVQLKSAQMIIDHLKKSGAVTTINSHTIPIVYTAIKGAQPHLIQKNKTSQQSAPTRQRIWQAMRYLNKFTVSELMMLSETSELSVRKFITALKKYKYVAIAAKSDLHRQININQRTGARYVLLKNTGRKYPVIGSKGLRDQNLNQRVPVPTTQMKNRR